MTCSCTWRGAGRCGRCRSNSDGPGVTEPALRVVRHVGTVDELHAIPMPTEGSAELWVMNPTGVAVAMGSSQRREHFDLDRLRTDEVELAARRSGGGAVFIDPAVTVWIDVVAPRGSRWYSDELAENFLLVGRVWQRALRSLGVETELGDTPAGRTAASTLACWAGLGWGELTLAGVKVVGLSQRRTRWGSRVQAMAVLDGSSARVADYVLPADRAVLREAIPAPEPGRRLGPDRAAVEDAVVRSFVEAES